MAVTLTPYPVKLSLRLNYGGSPVVYKTATVPMLRADVTGQTMWDLANKLALVLDHPMTSVERTKQGLLTEV
ncbi:MAG: hypothetical protein WCK89_13115 [bacterium]